MPTVQHSKRPKPHPSVYSVQLVPSAQGKSKLIEISDEEELHAEQLSEDEPGDEDGDEEDDDKKEEKEEEEEQDNTIEEEEEELEEEEEEIPFKFQSTWKALCGKELLPGVCSTYRTKDTLFMTNIERWRAKVLHDLEPRTFRSVRLLATASHERCRKADE